MMRRIRLSFAGGGGRNLAPDLVGKPLRFTILFLVLFALFGWQRANAESLNHYLEEVSEIEWHSYITFGNGVVYGDDGNCFSFSNANTAKENYGYVLKLESSTQVRFKTKYTSVIELEFSSGSNCKVDGTSYTQQSNYVRLGLNAGEHTITRGSAEAKIKSIRVYYRGDQATVNERITWKASDINNGNYYGIVNVVDDKMRFLNRGNGYFTVDDNRIKLVGSGTLNGEESLCNRAIKIIVGKAGTLRVKAAHAQGASASESRTLNIFCAGDNSTKTITFNASYTDNGDGTVFDIPNGDVLLYATGGINISEIEYIPYPERLKLYGRFNSWGEGDSAPEAVGSNGVYTWTNVNTINNELFKAFYYDNSSNSKIEYGAITGHDVLTSSGGDSYEATGVTTANPKNWSLGEGTYDITLDLQNNKITAVKKLTLKATWKINKAYTSKGGNKIDISELIEVKAGDVVLTKNDYDVSSTGNYNGYTIDEYKKLQGNREGSYNLDLTVTSKPSGSYTSYGEYTIPTTLPLEITKDKGSINNNRYSGLSGLPTLYNDRTFSPQSIGQGYYYDVTDVIPTGNNNEHAMRMYAKDGSSIIVTSYDIKLGAAGRCDASEAKCDRALKFVLGTSGTLKVKVAHGSTTTDGERILHIRVYNNSGTIVTDKQIKLYKANSNNGDGSLFNVAAGDVLIWAEGDGMNISEIEFNPGANIPETPETLSLCSNTTENTWNGGTSALAADVSENGVYKWYNVVIPAGGLDFKAYDGTSAYYGGNGTLGTGTSSMTIVSDVSDSGGNWHINPGTYNITLDIPNNRIIAYKVLKWDFVSGTLVTTTDGVREFKSSDGTEAPLYFKGDSYVDSRHAIQVSGATNSSNNRYVMIPVTGAGKLTVHYPLKDPIRDADNNITGYKYVSPLNIYNTMGIDEENFITSIPGGDTGDFTTEEIVIDGDKYIYIAFTGQTRLDEITWTPSEVQPLSLSWRYPRVVFTQGKTQAKLNKLIHVKAGTVELNFTPYRNHEFYYFSDHGPVGENISFPVWAEGLTSNEDPNKVDGQLSIQANSSRAGFAYVYATLQPCNNYSMYASATITGLPVDVIPVKAVTEIDKKIASDRPTVWRFSNIDEGLYCDIVNITPTLRLHVTDYAVEVIENNKVKAKEWWGDNDYNDGGDYSDYADFGAVVGKVTVNSHDYNVLKLSQSDIADVNKKKKVLAFNSDKTGTLIVKVVNTSETSGGSIAARSQSGTNYNTPDGVTSPSAADDITTYTFNVTETGITYIYVPSGRVNISEISFTPTGATLKEDGLVATIMDRTWSHEDIFGFKSDWLAPGEYFDDPETLNEGSSRTPANTLRIGVSYSPSVANANKASITENSTLDLRKPTAWAEIKVAGEGVVIVEASSNGPNLKELFVTTKKPTEMFDYGSSANGHTNTIKDEDYGCLLDSLSYKYQYTRVHTLYAEANAAKGFVEGEEKSIYIWSYGGVHINSIRWVPKRYITWQQDYYHEIWEHDHNKVKVQPTMLPDLCEWEDRDKREENNELWLTEHGTVVLYKDSKYGATEFNLTANVKSKASEAVPDSQIEPDKNGNGHDGQVGMDTQARTPIWWSSEKTNSSNYSDDRQQIAAYTELGFDDVPTGTGSSTIKVSTDWNKNIGIQDIVKVDGVNKRVSKETYWGIVYMVAGTSEGNVRDYCRVEVAGPAMGLTWDLSLVNRADTYKDGGYKAIGEQFELQAKPWCMAYDIAKGTNVDITLEDPTLKISCIDGNGNTISIDDEASSPVYINRNGKTQFTVKPNQAGTYIITLTTTKTAKIYDDDSKNVVDNDNIPDHSVIYVFTVADNAGSTPEQSVSYTETFIYNLLQRTPSQIDADLTAGKLLSEEYGQSDATRNGNDRSDILVSGFEYHHTDAGRDSRDCMMTNTDNATITIQPLQGVTVNENTPTIESIEVNCIRRKEMPKNASIIISYKTSSGQTLTSSNFILSYDNNYTALLKAPAGLSIRNAEITFKAVGIEVNQLKINYYTKDPDDYTLAPFRFADYATSKESTGYEITNKAFGEGAGNPLQNGYIFSLPETAGGRSSDIEMLFKKSQQDSRYFHVREAYKRKPGSEGADYNDRGDKDEQRFVNNVLVIADDEHDPCTMLFRNTSNKAEISSIEFYYETDYYSRNGFETGRRLYCPSDPRYNPVPGADQYVGFPLVDCELTEEEENSIKAYGGATEVETQEGTVKMLRKMVYRPESPVSFATITTDRHEEGFLFIRQIVVKYSQRAGTYGYYLNVDNQHHVYEMSADAESIIVTDPNISEDADYTHKERNKSHKFLLKRTSLENNMSYDVALERTTESTGTNVILQDRNGLIQASEGGTAPLPLDFKHDKFYTVRVLNENRMVIRQLGFRVEPLEEPSITYAYQTEKNGPFTVLPNEYPLANEPVICYPNGTSDADRTRFNVNISMSANAKKAGCHEHHVLIWTDDASEPSVTFGDDGRTIIDIHGNIGSSADNHWDVANLYSLWDRFKRNNNTIILKALTLPMKAVPTSWDGDDNEVNIQALKDLGSDKTYGENSLTTRAYYVYVDDNTDYIKFNKVDDKYIISREDLGEYAYQDEENAGRRIRGGFTKHVKDYKSSDGSISSKLAMTYGGYEYFDMKAPRDVDSPVFTHDILKNDNWKVVEMDLSSKLGVDATLVNNAYIEANIEPVNEDAINGGYDKNEGTISAGDRLDGVRIWSGEFDHRTHSALKEYSAADGNVENNERHKKTWNMPCYGGYLMFEPEADGDLTVYVKQPGAMEMEDNVLDDVMVKMRPVYIYDEAGNTPDGIEAFTTSKVSGYWNTTLHTEIVGDKYMDPEQSETFIEMCQQWIRNNTADINGDIEFGDRAYSPQGIIMVHKPSDYTNTDKDGNMLNYTYVDDYLNTINAFDDGVWNEKRERNGFMLVSEGFVRYSFPVKAGKTYFMFCNRGKLGLAAHTFVPKSTAATNGGNPYKIGGKSGDDWTSAAMNTHVKVQLNRAFKNDTWAALVLPFSIGKTELRRAFGPGVRVIHFNEITPRLLVFTHHVHQMVVAGTPVFIKPYFPELASGASLPASNFVFNNVTIEFADGDVGVYPITSGEGELKYMCTGSYSSAGIPVDSWYISGGKFAFNTRTSAVPTDGTRAWIVPVGAPAKQQARSIAQYISTSFNSYADLSEDDDVTTGFIQITCDPMDSDTDMNERNNVYNLKGQIVRKNSTDVTGLPKGVYIVNGIKHVVK